MSGGHGIGRQDIRRENIAFGHLFSDVAGLLFWRCAAAMVMDRDFVVGLSATMESTSLLGVPGLVHWGCRLSESARGRSESKKITRRYMMGLMICIGGDGNPASGVTELGGEEASGGCDAHAEGGKRGTGQSCSQWWTIRCSR